MTPTYSISVSGNSKAHPAIRVAAGELDALAERLRDAGEQVVWDVLRLRRYKDTDAARDGPEGATGGCAPGFFDDSPENTRVNVPTLTRVWQKCANCPGPLEIERVFV
jgi:hypothetical protein